MAIKVCTIALGQGGWRAEVGQMYDSTNVMVLTYPDHFSDPDDLTLTDDGVISDDLVLPATTGKGIKRGDGTSSSFGWKDLIGDVSPKQSGAGSPTFAAWRGGQVRSYFFAAGDDSDLLYHMPHDWVPGTDLFIHVHWGHNGTAISGSLVVDFYATFARGFSQAVNGDFIAEVNTTLTVETPDIATVPQYRHRVDEIQLTAASPTANQLDTDILEVDGLLLVHMNATTIPTISGGTQTKPSIFTVDLHYQSMDGGTTINKAPNFYG